MPLSVVDNVTFVPVAVEPPDNAPPSNAGVAVVIDSPVVFPRFPAAIAAGTGVTLPAFTGFFPVHKVGTEFAVAVGTRTAEWFPPLTGFALLEIVGVSHDFSLLTVDLDRLQNIFRFADHGKGSIPAAEQPYVCQSFSQCTVKVERI